jgi:hypothetical protein
VEKEERRKEGRKEGKEGGRNGWSEGGREKTEREQLDFKIGDFKELLPM